MPDYGDQLTVISSNYNDVRYQLGALSGQLEELAKGARLLTEYTCTATGFQDLSGAEILFRATPRQWQEGDIGILAVRLGEKEVAQTECTFTGSSCEAKLELPPANGYSYCFIQLHADGSREQFLVFVPDENGDVTLPSGTTLEPMVLYPLFEDAGAVEAAPAETEGA